MNLEEITHTHQVRTIHQGKRNGFLVALGGQKALGTTSIPTWERRVRSKNSPSASQHKVFGHTAKSRLPTLLTKRTLPCMTCWDALGDYSSLRGGFCWCCLMIRQHETWEGMSWNNEEDLAILTMVPAIVVSLNEQACLRQEAMWAVVARLNGVVFMELFLHDGLMEIFKYADIRIIVLFSRTRAAPWSIQVKNASLGNV